MQLDSDLPRSGRHVSAIAVVLFVVFCVLLLVDFSVTKAAIANKDNVALQIARSILENVMAGAVAAFILAIGYRWITQIIDPADRVIEISSDAIGRRLEKNAGKTLSYSFVGNTASYVTAAILPILCARTRKSGSAITVKVIVIDPREEKTIGAYLRHKDRVMRAQSRVANMESASWVRPEPVLAPDTSDKIAAKLLACIYLCANASKVSGIHLDVYLRRSFTPFRADMADNEVILTQESANESAVAFSSRGHFYGWYRKDAEALEQQCVALRFSDVAKFSGIQVLHPSSDLTSLGGAFDALMRGLFGDSLIVTEAIRSESLKRISLPSHSYGR